MALFRRGLFCCLHIMCYSSWGIQLQWLHITSVTYSILVLCIDRLITFECRMFTGLRDILLSGNHQERRVTFKFRARLGFFLNLCWTVPTAGEVSFVSDVTACTEAFLKCYMKRWYFVLIWSWNTWEKPFLHEKKNCSSSTRGKQSKRRNFLSVA